jgi:hypothetical protein
MAGQEKVLVINEKKLCRDIESKKKWAKWRKIASYCQNIQTYW